MSKTFQASLGIFLAAALLIAAGCTKGPALPKTYPAGGTVTDKAGKALKGGSIQLVATDDPLLRITGVIESDGTFKLSTWKDNAKQPGAPEGEFKATVQPPPPEGAQGGAPAGQKQSTAVELEKKLKVEAKDNTFTIVLP